MNETPKSKIKLYLALVTLLVLIIVGVFGYFKYKAFVTLIETSEVAIAENKDLKKTAEEYNALNDKLKAEKTRCEQLLLKEEGNFGEFTYCQKYIEFLDN